MHFLFRYSVVARLTRIANKQKAESEKQILSAVVLNTSLVLDASVGVNEEYVIDNGTPGLSLGRANAK